MPNTIAHFGVQTLISKGIDRTADFKWIALGCILPDIPWIIQRIARALPFGPDPVDLRLYGVVQASLFHAVLLAAAISLLAKKPGRIFLLLAGNCLLHLLLDATQIKWANGVNLVAPFSWQPIGFNLYWPEQYPTLILTGLGLAVMLSLGLRDTLKPVACRISTRRLAAALLLLGLYLGTPPLFYSEVVKANNHFLATLLDSDNRNGQYVECDRCFYDPLDQKIGLITGERLQTTGIPLSHPGSVSIQGVFLTPQKIKVTAWHLHHPFFRDLASKIGLLFILLLWTVALFKKRCRLD